MRIYCISGLGADFVAFKNLRINAELIPIDWITPTKNESLRSYCTRLIDQIDLSQEVNLMGVSFGGVVAQEICNIIKVKRKILISTVCSQPELPRFYLLGHKLKLTGLVSPRLLKICFPIVSRVFGLKNGKQMQLFRYMIDKTDTRFVKWAIPALLNYTNYPLSLDESIRIHGDKDYILPYPKNSSKAIRIIDGSHLMIFTKAKEVSRVINKFINDTSN